MEINHFAFCNYFKHSRKFCSSNKTVLIKRHFTIVQFIAVVSNKNFNFSRQFKSICNFYSQLLFQYCFWHSQRKYYAMHKLQI